MTTKTITLLKNITLWPLVLTQMCGALNDNLVKNAMIIMVLFKLGQGGAGLSALAGALFIIPYALLSATAGKLADRYSKPRLIVIYKFMEVALMIVSATGFLLQSQDILLSVLVGLGVQSALFSPVKYGLLPEHLAETELVAGNGIIEATTFMSIVMGTVLGGSLILLNDGNLYVSVIGIVLSLVGLYSAYRIPLSAPASPLEKIDFNIFRESYHVLKSSHQHRGIWLSILGLSWFWTIGATLMTEFPVIAHDDFKIGGMAFTVMLTIFALGTGFGSILCAKLLKGEISARHVPFSALGISLFGWDFASSCQSIALIPGLDNITSLAQQPMAWRVLIDLFLLATCGGGFSVPLYAIIQENSPKDQRARMIASNNIMNALFMVIGAGFTALMASFEFSPIIALKVAFVVNLAVTVWIIRLIPGEVYRALFRVYFEYLHGVEIIGMENVKKAGDRVVIISNHQSYLDACFISCYLTDNPTFAIHSGTASKWWIRIFTSAVDIFKVDVQSPYSIKLMVEAVRDQGRKLMIFPEGRLTRTGGLMRVFEGAGLIADKSHAMILPITIDGLQYSPLGRMGGKFKLRLFPKLRMIVHPPVDLSPDNAEELSPRQRREVIGHALYELMTQAQFTSKKREKTIFQSVIDASETYDAKTLISEDIQRQPIDYRKLLLGACALGRQFTNKITGKYVGVLLPNSNALTVSLVGMWGFGMIPAMLNFSSGSDAMISACRSAMITHVITSRNFILKGKLEDVIAKMEFNGIIFLYLEDIKQKIGIFHKIRAKWDSMNIRKLPGHFQGYHDPAVVLFTSGSEGKPKGVVHSHESILSNVAQLASVIDFHGGDKVFNAMPCFHSFGLMGGLILPLISGVRTFQYPSPLHYRIVPNLIYDTDATICFGTDTFLNGWAKYAHPYDFYAMRYIFAGAEKVKEETKRLYAEKFGVRVMEGYGATETAPALAMNTAMNSKANTVGKLLPGMQARLEAVPGVEHGGLLSVKGPNVMLGYLREDNPGVLEPVEDGWYNTGDIVEIDQEGFISIVGRVKRFAKIAGEMVSMTAAETLVTSISPDHQHAVVSQPDARKGEMLILATTDSNLTMKDILIKARERGIPEIMVPRTILVMDKIPLLGTGKVNYPELTSIVVEKMKS